MAEDFERLALPAAESHYSSSTAEFVGFRFHYSHDAQIGEEEIYTRGGQDSIYFQVTDATGLRLSYPESRGSFMIEGEDRSSGMVHHTVERDDMFRPTRVIGLKASEGTATKLARAVFGVAARSEDDSEESYDSPEGLINAALAGNAHFLAGEFQETKFDYDPDSGLISSITETLQTDGSIEKRVHQYFYDAHGRTQGYIERTLIDVAAGSGEEVYDITQLSVYEYNDENWREYAYRGFRDGLTPWKVDVHTYDRSSSGDIHYLREGVRPELVPYHVAFYRNGMPLFDWSGKSGLGSLRAEVPSWIPKYAADTVARGDISLQDAGTQPYFPETVDTSITWPRFAMSDALRQTGDVGATRFVNSLADHEQVILHNLDDTEIVMRLLLQRAEYADEPLNTHQQLSVIAAWHPVFARESAVPLSQIGQVNDAMSFNLILEALGIDYDQVRELVDGHPDLNEASRRCFDYLLDTAEDR